MRRPAACEGAAPVAPLLLPRPPAPPPVEGERAPPPMLLPRPPAAPAAVVVVVPRGGAAGVGATDARLPPAAGTAAGSLAPAPVAAGIALDACSTGARGTDRLALPPTPPLLPPT